MDDTRSVMNITESGTNLPQAEDIGAMIQAVLSPVLEAMAGFMAKNTEALDRLAASQKIQANRLEALERQIRLNTLVTPSQVKYFNESVKARARELLEKHGMDRDRKAISALSAKIRKSVLIRCGASALSEIPRHEYTVILEQIQRWNDLLTVRDIVSRAREKTENEGGDR